MLNAELLVASIWDRMGPLHVGGVGWQDPRSWCPRPCSPLPATPRAANVSDNAATTIAIPTRDFIPRSSRLSSERTNNVRATDSFRTTTNCRRHLVVDRCAAG